MDKAKRKGQALNLKRYWLIFGVLAIVLAIPFRIVGNWELTVTLWALIGVVVGLFIVRFVRRYEWKQKIVILMIVCTTISMIQIWQTPFSYHCTNTSSDTAIVQIIRCDTSGWCTYIDYATIQNTSIGIQLEPYPNWYINAVFVCTLF